MIDSRCGLHCTDCQWKESAGCGGCIPTMGHPFHGECAIAVCCQNKGHAHCGECDSIPCDRLYAFSYLDPEHGDTPQGARVEVCRRWAADNGKNAWENVLLTSAGFEDFDGRQKKKMTACFLSMLCMPAGEARVLFIPTAAVDDEAKKMAVWCEQELTRLGIKETNFFTYDIDGTLTEKEAMTYDVVYFTGGDTAHLLRRVKATGFDATIKKMVYANKVYVGTSAGSLIAAPNIAEPYAQETAGLCFLHARLSVHCQPDDEAKTTLPQPRVLLTDNQAVRVRWNGYEVLEG